MIKVLPVKILFQSHISLGLFSKNMLAPNVLLCGSVNWNNSLKELNIDMEISSENQCLHSKFQKASSYFPVTSTTCHVDSFCFWRKESIISNLWHPSFAPSLSIWETGKVNNKVPNSFEPGVSQEHK